MKTPRISGPPAGSPRLERSSCVAGAPRQRARKRRRRTASCGLNGEDAPNRFDEISAFSGGIGIVFGLVAVADADILDEEFRHLGWRSVNAAEPSPTQMNHREIEAGEIKAGQSCD
jgi:hypothetical protein